jgi:hypothetical protein
MAPVLPIDVDRSIRRSWREHLGAVVRPQGAERPGAVDPPVAVMAEVGRRLRRHERALEPVLLHERAGLDDAAVVHGHNVAVAGEVAAHDSEAGDSDVGEIAQH